MPDDTNMPAPPDVSDLPVQSAPNQYTMQNANVAMTPQVQQPQPAGNGGVIRNLLSDFFHGGAEAIMHEYGMETPEQKQQRQFNNQIQLQNAQSLQDLRNSMAEQNELVPYQLPANPDGTPGQVLQIPRKSAAALGVQTLRNQGTAAVAGIRAQAGGTQVTPQMAQQYPQLQGMEGQTLSKPMMDFITRTSTATITAQNRKPSAAARDDRYIDLMGRDQSTWTQDDQNFIKGYNKFVDFTKIAPGVQRAQIFAAPRWAQMNPVLQAQQAMAKSIAAGPYANQLSSFNAFVGHLGDFHDAVKDLGNLDTRYLNMGLNRLALETGDAKVQSVIAKIEPVRKEFESLLLNNRALYEADRQSADVILNMNSSPAQIETAVRSLAKTAGIRLGAVNSNVKRVIGADIPGILEPSNGAILQELGGDIPGYEGSGMDFNQTFGLPQAGGRTAGPRPQTPKSGGGTIRVRLKDGRTGSVPASAKQKYLNMGAEILP